MKQMDERVTIITGAARGHGAAAARLFVAEGGSVVITDIRQEQGAALADELGNDAIFIKHDVTSKSDWQLVVETAMAKFGRIDALVNNAGIVGFKSILETDEEELQLFLSVHLLGAHYGIKAVIPPMRAGGGGVIVNIASGAALRGYQGLYGYGISKWGLRGLSRYAAVDLASLNIRVNSILPGGVDTPMLTETATGPIIDVARATVPMGRFAAGEEIASVALFLCSNASGYMTGAELVVDGGVSA